MCGRGARKDLRVVGRVATVARESGRGGGETHEYTEGGRLGDDRMSTGKKQR